MIMKYRVEIFKTNVLMRFLFLFSELGKCTNKVGKRLNGNNAFRGK